eukprot:Rhum_TRINITY_DN14705_c14_g1::Rhum_TRINITY_DN14705_c14_g1_i1::g.112282::m.112282
MASCSAHTFSSISCCSDTSAAGPLRSLIALFGSTCPPYLSTTAAHVFFDFFSSPSYSTSASRISHAAYARSGSCGRVARTELMNSASVAAASASAASGLANSTPGDAPPVARRGPMPGTPWRGTLEAGAVRCIPFESAAVAWLRHCASNAFASAPRRLASSPLCGAPSAAGRVRISVRCAVALRISARVSATTLFHGTVTASANRYAGSGCSTDGPDRVASSAPPGATYLRTAAPTSSTFLQRPAIVSPTLPPSPFSAAPSTTSPTASRTNAVSRAPVGTASSAHSSPAASSAPSTRVSAHTAAVPPHPCAPLRRWASLVSRPSRVRASVAGFAKAGSTTQPSAAPAAAARSATTSASDDGGSSAAAAAARRHRHRFPQTGVVFLHAGEGRGGVMGRVRVCVFPSPSLSHTRSPMKYRYCS